MTILTDLTMIELAVPVICSSMLILGVLILSIIYSKNRDDHFLSIILMGCFGFLFSFSEIFVLISGVVFDSPDLGRQFHRIEQLSGACFIFVACFHMSSQFKLFPAWSSFNRKIVLPLTLVISILFIVAGYLLPDYFISQTGPDPSSILKMRDMGRGHEGILYYLRDALLTMSTLYMIVGYIYEMAKNKRAKALMPPFIGITIAGICALDDSSYVYFSNYYGVFGTATFSRFSLGITGFILVCMIASIVAYVEQAKGAETANIEMELACSAMQASEERFKQLADNINEIFFIYDQGWHKFIYASPAYENIFGQDISDLYSDPEIWKKNIHPDDLDLVLQGHDKAMGGDPLEIKYRLQRPGCETIWIGENVYPVKDHRKKVYRLVRVLADITASQKYDDEISYLAFHDSLTGLGNRQAFLNRLEDIVVQHRRGDEKFTALAFMDIDRFKQVNELYGYELADKLLIKISESLQALLRKTDYIYRLGSDEFALIVTHLTDDLNMAGVIEKINAWFKQPVDIDGTEVKVTVSLGVTVHPKDGETTSQLVRNLGLALLEAKKEQNTYRFFSEKINSSLMKKLQMEKDIAEAIEKDQFDLYYQPFVDMEGRITGMEALIRWFHPVMGYVSPEDFIPIAERSNIILELGMWVMDKACQHIKRCHDTGYLNIRVAVNLSARQFLSEDLVDCVTGFLDQYKLPARALELEITETCVMRDPAIAVANIEKLFHAGISCSVDDFGTGYSSLSYLQRFKVDRLKIDKTFVDNIEDDQNAKLMRAIVAMGHSLNLSVIAEGVETMGQLEFLALLGCDEMQGYLFSPAVSSDDFMVLLGAADFPSKKITPGLHVKHI